MKDQGATLPAVIVELGASRLNTPRLIGDPAKIMFVCWDRGQ